MTSAYNPDWTNPNLPAAGSIRGSTRTGKYRLGKDKLIVDDKGKSTICAAQDEDSPQHPEPTMPPMIGPDVSDYKTDRVAIRFKNG